MAITTTTVTGPLLDASGNAIADEFIFFRTVTAGADNDVVPTTVIGRTKEEAQTDSSGNFSKVLWVNGDSDILSVYEITTATGKINATQVIIPISAGGGTIAIGELLINHVVSGSTSQQSSVLNDAMEYTDQEIDAFAADPSSVGTFDPAEWKADLSLVVGTDVQAWDQQLDDIAVIAPTDGRFLVGNGVAFVPESGSLAQQSLGVESGSGGGGQVGSSSSTNTGGAIGSASSSTTGFSGGVDAQSTTGAAIGAESFATTGFAGGAGAVASQSGGVQLGTGINAVANTWQFQDSGTITVNETAVLQAPQTFPIFAASDFPSPLVDGTQYNIFGAIDMGSTSLIVPVSGSRVTICGKGPSASLTSSENSYTMFTDGVNSGAVKFENILLSVTGTSSHLGNLTNDGTSAFVLDRVTLFGCTNCFTLNGNSFVSFVRSQDFNCLNGHTIDGACLGIDVAQYGSFGMASGGITFHAGASLVVSGRTILQGLNNMPTGSTYCDFAPANILADSGFEVIETNFAGDGTFFSNIDEKNIKSRWKGNVFPSIPPDNTHVGGGWHIAQSGDEVINSTTPTVYLKVNGTTTPLDLQWFSAGTANDLTADSTRAISVEISGVIYFTGTNNQTIQCKLVKDDGTPEDIFELGEIEFVGTAAPTAYPINGIVTVITSAATVIEVHAKTSSGSFTAKVHSNLQVSERT